MPAPTQALSGTHRAFRSSTGCGVIARRARQGGAGWDLASARRARAWHLDLAPDRYPTWDEIAAGSSVLVPDAVTIAPLLPPPAEYVNAHPHCFHLWQIDDRRADR